MKVAASPARLTPQHLEKTISATYGLDKACTKELLKDLIAQGEIEYTYEFGSTYLVPSFNKPVRISAHVVVQPPEHQFQPAPDDVVIRIQPGSAFGDGRHPTTRLAVNAIEFVLKDVRPDWIDAGGSLLDIGTGSGILAMTAVCLGIKRGLGIDIDSIALAEARENLVLNHLQDRLMISDRHIEAIDATFSLVIANLRYPSLVQYCARISKLTASKSWVILSGVRPPEMQKLMKRYSNRHFEPIWRADELDWSASALQKI